MPGFDGTGPRGQGPMTGRAEGFCALRIPDSGGAPDGYAGLQGTPVGPGTPAVWPEVRARFARWLRSARWPLDMSEREFGRSRCRGAGLGRGQSRRR
jgi:hypothetical protein